jgi:hypothetical protein
VLLKIRSFMLRTHHSLACVGVTAMERLVARTGPQMSDEMWTEVIAGILQVAEATKPDLRRLVDFPPERYFRSGRDGAHEGGARALPLCPAVRTSRAIPPTGGWGLGCKNLAGVATTHVCCPVWIGVCNRGGSRAEREV